VGDVVGVGFVEGCLTGMRRPYGCYVSACVAAGNLCYCLVEFGDGGFPVFVVFVGDV
jgi:hypothetical protein